MKEFNNLFYNNFKQKPIIKQLYGTVPTVQASANSCHLLDTMLAGAAGPLSWLGGWTVLRLLAAMRSVALRSVARMVRSSARSLSVFNSTSAKGSASPSKSGQKITSSYYIVIKNNYRTSLRAALRNHIFKIN
jgi:hypothetical protein